MTAKYENLMRNWGLVIFCILAIFSTASISGAATISGYIYNTAGVVQQNVPVNLLNADNRSYIPGMGTCSDALGVFQISNIPPGKYLLLAGGDGCNSSTAYAKTFYHVDSSGNFVRTYDPQNADQFNLTGGENIPGKNFYLEPGASISGMVTVPVGATPLNVNIGVNPVGISNWGYGACTDSSGSYSVRGISPGTYRISAGGSNWCGGSCYQQVFYNNKPDWNSADLITLSAGDSLTINFSLLLGAVISGTIYDKGTVPQPQPNVPVNLWNADNRSYVQGASSDASGNFIICGIPPGNYFLVAGGGAGPGTVYAQTFYAEDQSGKFVGTYDPQKAYQFNLTGTETLTGKNFYLEPGASISGTVTVPAGATPQNVNVGAWPVGINWGYGACTDQYGNYSIKGLPPGTYRIPAGGSNWCGGSFYQQKFYDNKPDSNSADLITLSAGDSRNINFSVVLAAAISGKITGDLGMGGINVVIHDSAGRLVNFQTVSDRGSYYFSGLTPGSYTVKVYDPFLNYQYAEKAGLSVTLGNETKADFTLIPLEASGVNPPTINRSAIPFMAFVIRYPDQTEERMVLRANISDASGPQPYCLKNVIVEDPAGQIHYLYHQKYEHNLYPNYEFWMNTRDNELSKFSRIVGDYRFTVIDADGNKDSVTVSLPSYTQNKLDTPVLHEITGEVDPSQPITLSWDSVDGVVFYKVRFSRFGEWLYEQNTRSNYIVVPAATLDAGAFYNWNVQAFDGDGTTATPIHYDSLSRTSGFFTKSNVPPSQETLSVQIVPWVPGSPLIPHDAYAGRQTTLKAVAKGGSPPYTHTWNFGDGSFSTPTTTSNRYNLEAFHQYSTIADTFYDAQITVADSTGATVSARYPIRFWADPSRGVKVNVAIDDALWWLHKNMSRFTSGGIDYGQLSPGSNPSGSTALALQAWLLNGHTKNGSPDNPYVEDVNRAISFIIDQLYPISIGPETVAGVTRNPDSNGDGIGLYVKNGARMYETSLVLMALATLQDPSLTKTIQNLVDFLAYGQVEPDAGGGRGGWRYDANYRESDMSVTQFPLIGLEAAGYHLGSSVTIPSYVKNELRNNFLYFVQNKESGGFGYSWPNSSVNVAKTGAGIVGLALTGILYDDPRTTQALSYIDHEWLTAMSWPNIAGMRYNIGDLYAMYAVMKGMKSYEMKGYNTTMIGSHDWYNEYAIWEIQHQNSNGSWQSPVNSYGPVIDTTFGVLILLPQIFGIGPTAVAQASPTNVWVGQPVTFSHSQSFHRDTTKTIDLYEWDFNGDGIIDWSTPSQLETHQYIYGFAGSYKATLKVTDSAGLVATDQVTITVISPPNRPPDCKKAKPNSAEIWPPDHKMVALTILGVTDPDGDPVSIIIKKITQDEPVNGLGDGDTAPDGSGVGTSTPMVRAERSGKGNGRVYIISFTADDGKSGTCAGSVSVCVPHDMSPKHQCVDDGQKYDSTKP